MDSNRMNPRVKALGETVLRVRDLQAVKRFYVDVIGLDILREFDGIAFLKVSDGYGGHTQIIGLFHEALPVPFPKDPREPVRLEGTSLHHFALEIDEGDFPAELDRFVEPQEWLKEPNLISAHSHWMPQTVRLEGLGLELVEKGSHFTSSRLDDRAAVLPDRVFSVMASTNWIPLILVDIVDTKAIGKRLTQDIEPDAWRNDGFEVGQGLNARPTVPWWIPTDKV
jgi:catechol 2,3-dioxygenase-like lactoylglutathione lyase family enzyme